MEYKTLHPSDPEYPLKIRQNLGSAAPALHYSGPLSYLNRFTMGVLCADSAGGQALTATNDLLFVIREFDINYIGPWHSVIETEIFRLALYRERDLTLFTAKGLGVETFESFLLDRFYPPLDKFPEKEEFFRRAESGDLLILSAAPPQERKQLRSNIIQRKLLTCVLSDVIFVPFASKGSKTLSVVRKAKSFGVPMFTTEGVKNNDLGEIGIVPQTRKELQKYLEKLISSKPASTQKSPECRTKNTAQAESCDNNPAESRNAPTSTQRLLDF